MISRRHFLQLGARSAAALAGGAGLLHLTRMSALAQAATGYRALVCVFLHGGNDGNNTIVPVSGGAYADYARARGPLALTEGSLVPISAPGGEVYGLHPQLAGLDELFEQGHLAVVANVGTLVRPLTRDEYLGNTAPVPLNLFSHLDQQLAWQTGDPAERGATGWGGRVADRIAPGNAFPAVVSVAGNAAFGIGAATTHATIVPGFPPGLVGVDGSDGTAARLRSFHDLLALESGSVLVNAANATTREGLRQAELLKAALSGETPPSTPFPQSQIGQQLAEVAKVIKVREELGATRQIFFCSLGGFDTHVGQLQAQANALTQLRQAMTAFYAATIELGVDDQVTTFTQSEFGRTLQPTSATGSDHAWGSHHVVMGGAVRGGAIYGTFPTLAATGPDDVGTRGVWLPTSSLDQYGATFASWLGVAAADLPGVFPNIGNFAISDLGFLKA
jgi:uncharacterized protein (DUF1501 family)